MVLISRVTTRRGSWQGVKGPVTGNLGQSSAALAAAEGFTCLVDLTVVSVAIPYLFSASAQLTFLVSGRRQVAGVVTEIACGADRGGPLGYDRALVRADRREKFHRLAAARTTSPVAAATSRARAVTWGPSAGLAR